MKRAEALGAIKAAGYHGDAAAATRLYLQHNISHAAYRQAYGAGEAARAAGTPCGCLECKKGKLAAPVRTAQPEQQQAQALARAPLALPPVMTRERNCAQWRQHMAWAGAAQERIRAADTPEAIEAARQDAQAEARECARLTDRLVELRDEVTW